MAYGKRSIYRKSSAGSYRRSRFGTRSITKAPYRKKTRSYARKPRFATVGYVRDQEKKYCDKPMRITETWVATNVTINGGLGGEVYGVKHTAGLGWNGVITNLLSGVVGGSDATSRIGNKINVKYLQVGMTLQAARSAMPMGGEQENNETIGAEDGVDEYMKTNFRIVLVKDLQANNNSNTISWDQVFGNSDELGIDTAAMASSDMLEISNMGRFIIVKDMRMTLDANDPLRSVNFIQRGIGEVRYSSNTSTALTNVGYHLLVGQDTVGTAVSATRLKPSPVMANTRLCFTE